MPGPRDVRQNAPRYGSYPIVCDGNFPASGLAAGTTTICCGVPSREYYVEQCTFGSAVVLIAATSATMQFYRQTAAGVTRVNLTSTQNVLAAGGLVALSNFVVPLLSTLTDNQRTVVPGDLLLVDLVIVGSVTAQFGANGACFELDWIK